MKTKKGQITVFLVLVLIIIVGGGVFFYLTKKVPRPDQPEIKIVEQNIPVEFDPIKKFTTDCLYSVTIEGLIQIGEQGGYVSFTDKNLNKEPFTITKNPTESDAVYFSQNAQYKIPYWWYLKSQNNCKGDCKFSTKRPELRSTDNSIEKQLERYVDANIKECIADFKDFKSTGYIISEGKSLKTDITIAKEDVITVLEYPITVEKAGTTTIEQFNTRVSINLESIYNLATQITNMEMKNRYLEKQVLNTIVAFSGVDKKKLPPMSDMEFKFGSTTSWRKSEVKNKVTGLIATNIPLFQVDGTYNYQRNLFDDDLKQRIYDSTIIPVANQSYSSIDAFFTYLDFWQVYFDLNCNGDQCRPSSVSSLVPNFGIQTYNFAYDVSFPVLVELKDEFALNGRGYNFNFFLEGNIRNNKPMPVDFAPLEQARISERSQLCDLRTSKNVTVNAQKSGTGKEPLQDAQIIYTVLDEGCFIGSTDAKGMMREQFPIALGGYVTVSKEDHISKTVEFDADSKIERSLKTELTPIYTKNIVVKKKKITKTSSGWQFQNVPETLNGRESAIVTLARKPNDGEAEFSGVAGFEGNQEEKSEVQIAPGDYSVDIQLILNERIVIPEKQKCVKKGIFGEKECYTINRIDFGEKSTPGSEKFPEGGLKLNMTLNAKDLERSGTVTFYAVAFDIASVPESARVIEDLEQMGKTEQYSTIYQLQLQPDFG